MKLRKEAAADDSNAFGHEDASEPVCSL